MHMPPNRIYYRICLQIRQFLVKHPGEVVLLDFQHFHGLTANDHLVLVTYIKELFTDLICPYFHQLDHLSLAYLARFKYQVLVFYRHTQTMQNVSWLWSGASLPNPWPDTTSITSLLAFLEDKLRSRSHNTFFVTQ
ncbi:PI-PLC X domain-containing protein 2-like [Homarus americanus]|uniref:PI-PLC X domain-containing protein 2-like n=1 Tax=Homarus americanus TaxID=6706 RepID=A0A8J5KA98_HOMAM|nr:PI-PLC X domain-containing protein 2-like [Homarus americanus]